MYDETLIILGSLYLVMIIGGICLLILLTKYTSPLDCIHYEMCGGVLRIWDNSSIM